MNIEISREYIENTLGNESLLQTLTTLEVHDAILYYVIPWLGAITGLSNFIVVFFCLVIYLKTKRKNHKPAFVFIGFLASIDSIMGWYAKHFRP
jgi:hypothetical protein